MKKRILLTNDDGYEAKGILYLKEALKEIGEVWVVAPDKERSTSSHSMTLGKAVGLKQIEDKVFISDGTPVDCIYLGVNLVMAQNPPHLTVAGINRGANLGTDIYYSGTVAAARESALKGIPAVAISLVKGDNFLEASKYSAIIIKSLLELNLPSDIYFNINIPEGSPQGIKIAPPGIRYYPRVAKFIYNNNGTDYYILGGGLPVEDGEKLNSDGYWIKRSWITITPLSIEFSVNQKIINELEEVFKVKLKKEEL